MDIIFIRHGWTSFNEEGLMCGFSDPGLSEFGKKELSDMVKEYPYPPAEKLYSSPFKRCLETGAIIYPQNIPFLVKELHEMDFGVYDGFPAAAVKKEFAGFGENGDESAKIPGGESKAEVAQRMIKAMDWIVADAKRSGYRTIAVVGHSLAFSQLLKRCLKTPLSREQSFCPNGMGFLVRMNPEEFLENHRLEYIMGLPEHAKRPDMSHSPYISRE